MSEKWDFDVTEEAESDSKDNFNYRISSYPADITLKGYQDKWDKNQLTIPKFQRNYVWDQVKASKLIESFLLGLPVPGVFLYKDRETKKLSVIDGQQRILSAIRFYKGLFDDKAFRLKNVREKWEGKSYLDLDESDQLQLDDTVLRATVVEQLDPEDDSSIYHIFERLNTGGVNLNPMEIRKCVYFGELLDRLEELNANEHWRSILFKERPDKRLRDIELILRVLSLSENLSEYSKPMKGFLNDFVSKINKIKPEEKQQAAIERLSSKFVRASEVIDDKLPEKPFHLRGRINYAAMDSIFYAVMKLDEIPQDLSERYQQLVADEDYIHLATINTSDDSTLQARFALASRHLCDEEIS